MPSIEDSSTKKNATTASLSVSPALIINDQSTEELRRIPDSIPWVVLLIIVIEFGERFTYFGLSGPIQNYIKYVACIYSINSSINSG